MPGIGMEKLDLSVREKIILHIYGCLERSGGKVEAPMLTQTGIAEALNITRAHAAIELERGSDRNLFYAQRAKSGGGKREVKVYLLTPNGIDAARRLRERRESARIVEESLTSPSKHSPDRVFQGMEKGDLILLCALRIGGELQARHTRNSRKVPFVVRNGNKLQISEFAASAVDRLLSDEMMKKLAYSYLADYSLYAGNHLGRLEFLIAAGRISEAERLVEYHSQELQELQPSETVSSLVGLEGWLDKPGAALLYTLSRALLELGRPGEAKERVDMVKEADTETRIAGLMARIEASGRPAAGSKLSALGHSVQSDRERSMYHRLYAINSYHSKDLESAEKEIGRAVRISNQSGDVPELRINYSLLSKIERARGDYAEAARAESKLRGIERLHAGKSE